ncbi:MAG: hypothetical protein KDK23_15835, partial [Leptospiraceae bacterium]|nr:hypothetical protein [Leptospiraceae bacterium]
MKNTKRKSFLFVLICSTFLLLMREGLALASGVPPAEGEQILAWARKETLLIALANECLGIGAMLLLFVAHPMHRLLAPYGTHRAGGLFSLLIAT